MEWVEITAKTVEAAKDEALNRLGVARDEAEFQILEEPRSGLFGLMRGQARVRARVRPASVRPKNDRRRRAKRNAEGRDKASSGDGSSNKRGDRKKSKSKSKSGDNASGTDGKAPAASAKRAKKNDSTPTNQSKAKPTMETDERSNPSPVSPQEVATAAESFLSGLASAFDYQADVSATVDGEEIDVTVDGDELGLMIGPSGRTLNAIQDLTRVSAQRRLGDHATRLRVDVGGYRQKRQAALERFTTSVANKVIETGERKALEPMSSADRKVVHDTVNGIEGVESRSDGEDPARRVVIVPAD